MKRTAILGIMCALLPAGATAQSSSVAAVQLKAAIHKELVDGDLTAAIDQFRKLLKRPGLSRADTAKVLLHLGQCYEKQGNGEARKSYEQLVRDYGDQKEEVTEARGRLAAMGHGSMAPGDAFAARLVWSGHEADTSGSASADGRYLSYVHWETGDLAIRDLVSGTSRMLTHEGTWARPSAYADTNAISPDGKQIAYMWDNKKVHQLRVINSDGTGMRVLRTADWFRPRAWSPDGKFILSEVQESPARTNIAWIAVANGDMRILKTLEGRNRDRFILSPDARYIAYNRPADKTRTDRDIFLISVDGASETPLLNDPADEYALGWSADGRYLVYASNRLNSYSAYLLPVASGKAQGAPQLVRRDIGEATPLGLTRSGRLYYGFWGNENTRTSVELYSAGLDVNTGKIATAPEPAATSISGSNGVGSFSPDGKYLAYRHGWPSKPEAVVRPLQGGDPLILHPKLSTWAISGWRPDGKSLLILGRPGQTLDKQGAYGVDLATGETAPVLLNPGKQIHLAAWSTDGASLVYAVARTVFARNIATGQERQLYESSDPVLRIAVSGDGKYVAIANRRVIALVPFQGGDTRELLRLQDREEITGWTLAWMPDSRHLVFVKRRIELEKKELWRVSVETGRTEDLGLKQEDIEYVSISPDGRQIAFEAATKSKTEIWAIDNFLPR